MMGYQNIYSLRLVLLLELELSFLIDTEAEEVCLYSISWCDIVQFHEI